MTMREKKREKKSHRGERRIKGDVEMTGSMTGEEERCRGEATCTTEEEVVSGPNGER